MRPNKGASSRALDSIIQNTLFSFIARGIDVVVTFVLAIILARYLGAEGIGVYTYIVAFAAIFVPLVDLGLDHILIRDITRRQDLIRDYVGAALLLKFLIALVALPLGMTIAALVSHNPAETRAMFLCFLGTLVVREIPTIVAYAVFLAKERMEYRVVATFLFQIAKFVFTLPVILLGGDLVWIFAAALLAEASQGLVALRYVVKKFCRPHFSLNLPLWRYYVKESLPLGIAFAFNSYYFQVDILLLKYFRGDAETGLFGVPFRIITTLFTLLIPMIWVLLPHLTRAAKTSVAKLHEDGQGYLKAIFVITAGITLFLSIEARDITLQLFGAEFERSALVLAVIAPVIVFHAFLYFFDLTLTAVGRQRLVIVGSSVIFGVKFLVDLFCIPRYGIMGAAIGTLIADLTCFGVMLYLTRKYVTSFNFFSIMVAPLAAALCAGWTLWLVRSWPFYVTAVIFGLTYAFFIWLFKVISPDQRQFLKDRWRELQRKAFNRSNGSAL